MDVECGQGDTQALETSCVHPADPLLTLQGDPHLGPPATVPVGASLARICQLAQQVGHHAHGSMAILVQLPDLPCRHMRCAQHAEQRMASIDALPGVASKSHAQA